MRREAAGVREQVAGVRVQVAGVGQPGPAQPGLSRPSPAYGTRPLQPPQLGRADGRADGWAGERRTVTASFCSSGSSSSSSRKSSASASGGAYALHTRSSSMGA